MSEEEQSYDSEAFKAAEEVIREAAIEAGRPKKRGETSESRRGERIWDEMLRGIRQKLSKD